jgi:hypothetical protein
MLFFKDLRDIARDGVGPAGADGSMHFGKLFFR